MFAVESRSASALGCFFEKLVPLAQAVFAELPKAMIPAAESAQRQELVRGPFYLFLAAFSHLRCTVGGTFQLALYA